MKNTIKLMVISALAFAILNVFVKDLKQFNVYQIVFFRSIGTLFFTIPILLKKKINVFGNKKGLLILRSVVGFSAMTLFFMSLKHLLGGTAVSIRYISPVFGAIFAYFILKEKIKPIQWVYFVLAFIGVLIIKGFNSQISTIALAYIVTSAVLTGMVYIIIRKIGEDDDSIVIVNYFMIISTLLGGILMIPNWITPTGSQWLILLSLGVFGYFGQYYMTKALQSSEINQVAPLKYIEVVFTILIGVTLLEEKYSFLSLIGTLLILVGLTLNTILKSRMSK